MKTEEYKVKIPVYYVSYIEYGDSEGLTEEETARIDKFLEQFNRPVFSYEEESHFSWGNDIDGLGGDIMHAVVTDFIDCPHDTAQ